MNYVGSNRLSLKYQGFPPSDYQDIGIRKFEFVAKTQFLFTIVQLLGCNLLDGLTLDFVGHDFTDPGGGA